MFDRDLSGRLVDLDHQTVRHRRLCKRNGQSPQQADREYSHSKHLHSLKRRRRTVARLDQSARIVVRPVGRTPNPPHHDLFLNTHDFEMPLGAKAQAVGARSKRRR
jgi:hypothetical protein